MDRLTRERRSWLMSQVKNKNTSAEMRVRRAAHALGLRYRLHRQDLPGTPDIVLPKHRTVIFVHGCFWHRHPGCRKSSMPKSRTQFWQAKFDRTVARDQQATKDLGEIGWTVTVIWECETKSEQFLSRRLRDAFNIR